MDLAYVDTSCLVGIAFREPGYGRLIRRLNGFDALVSSNLLEAELASVFARQKLEFDRAILGALRWVFPDRALQPEIARVLSAGYVRGADCWHLATALYVAGDPSEMTFLTLDAPQRKTAEALGFAH